MDSRGASFPQTETSTSNGLSPTYLHSMQTPTCEYRALFEQAATPEDLAFQTAENAAQAACNTAVESERRALLLEIEREEQGKPARKRVNRPKNRLPDLHPCRMAELRNEHTRGLAELREAAKAAKQRHENSLAALADLVAHTKTDGDISHLAESCDTSVFSTQTAEHAYAKGSLKPLQDALEKAGYRTEIHFKELGSFNTPYETKLYGIYELWTNAAPWQADAVDRSLTYNEILNSLLDTSLNPAVVFLMNNARLNAYWQHWKNHTRYPVVQRDEYFRIIKPTQTNKGEEAAA